MKYSFAQQLDTLRKFRIVDHRALGCRPSELDLLRAHLDAVVASIEALEQNPDIAEQLRERLRSGRRGAV